MSQAAAHAVQIAADGVRLEGDLGVPEDATGLVLFAHGSGSSRHSPRNRFVAGRIQEAGVGTLLFDLLSLDEEAADQVDAHLRFDIPLLAHRLLAAAAWVRDQEALRDLRIGYFGSSTGGAAALVAAARRPEACQAVVSRGGRPDLARDALPEVACPTLLIVGGRDAQVLRLNEEARRRMGAPVDLDVVPGATHLFEEPGALEDVAGRAARFFSKHLAA